MDYFTFIIVIIIAIYVGSLLYVTIVFKKAELRLINKPECYKSNPSPQSQAENCCEDCEYIRECIK